MAEHQSSASMTVTEWCSHRRLSLAMAYKLWTQGKGPKSYNIGTRRYISHEADAQCSQLVKPSQPRHEQY